MPFNSSAGWSERSYNLLLLTCQPKSRKVASTKQMLIHFEWIPGLMRKWSHFANQLPFFLCNQSGLVSSKTVKS